MCPSYIQDARFLKVNQNQTIELSDMSVSYVTPLTVGCKKGIDRISTGEVLCSTGTQNPSDYRSPIDASLGTVGYQPITLEFTTYDPRTAAVLQIVFIKNTTTREHILKVVTSLQSDWKTNNL